MVFSISSSAFKDGGGIPSKYTCEGKNISLPLEWSEPPVGTKSLALIFDDPVAISGVFTHWIVFNLPADTRRLSEGMPRGDRLQNDALQGTTSYGKAGYGGPCPPPGPVHHYRFILYALDKMLELGAGASKKQVLDALKGHVLAQTQLTGLYQR